MPRPRGRSSPTTSRSRRYPLVSRGRLTPDPGHGAPIGPGIESDYECAELLARSPAKPARRPRGQRAYAEAADGSAALRAPSGPLGGRQTGSLSQGPSRSIQSARGIKSDYERASLLVEIARRYNLSGARRDAYLEPPARSLPTYERQRAQAAAGGAVGRGRNGTARAIRCPGLAAQNTRPRPRSPSPEGKGEVPANQTPTSVRSPPSPRRRAGLEARAASEGSTL